MDVSPGTAHHHTHKHDTQTGFGVRWDKAHSRIGAVMAAVGMTRDVCTHLGVVSSDRGRWSVGLAPIGEGRGAPTMMAERTKMPRRCGLRIGCGGTAVVAQGCGGPRQRREWARLAAGLAAGTG